MTYLWADKWSCWSHGGHPWPAMVQQWSITQMEIFQKKFVQDEN